MINNKEFLDKGGHTLFMQGTDLQESGLYTMSNGATADGSSSKGLVDRRRDWRGSVLRWRPSTRVWLVEEVALSTNTETLEKHSKGPILNPAQSVTKHDKSV